MVDVPIAAMAGDAVAAAEPAPSAAVIPESARRVNMTDLIDIFEKSSVLRRQGKPKEGALVLLDRCGPSCHAGPMDPILRFNNTVRRDPRIEDWFFEFPDPLR